MQDGAAGGDGESAGDGEQPQPQPFGLYRRAWWPASASICIHAVSSQASETRAHQIWFWVKSCSEQVGQPGVLGAPDPVLGAGPAAVSQLPVGQLPVPCSGWRVGGQASEPVSVGVGEPQLRTRMGAFLAHDHPHPGRPGRQVEQVGDLGNPSTVTDLPAGVVGRRPHRIGDAGHQLGGMVGQGNPTE